MFYIWIFLNQRNNCLQEKKNRFKKKKLEKLNKEMYSDNCFETLEKKSLNHSKFYRP